MRDRHGPTRTIDLTGFSGEASNLILTKSHTLLVSDGRFKGQLAEECPGLDAYIRPPDKALAVATIEQLTKLAVRSIGFESGQLTVAEFEQLKDGVRALHAPLNTLEANWAYMVIASLAWSIKAWAALLLPVSARWRERHQADQEQLLRMDFRTFLHAFILVPAQILMHGRQLIIRLLAWRPTLPTLFRLLDAL